MVHCAAAVFVVAVAKVLKRSCLAWSARWCQLATKLSGMSAVQSLIIGPLTNGVNIRIVARLISDRSSIKHSIPIGPTDGPMRSAHLDSFAMVIGLFYC